jgi:hypothetical protein
MDIRKCSGCIHVSWDIILSLLAPPDTQFAVQYYLPPLPDGVFVHSVHSHPLTGGFEFIITSDEPVEGWTTDHIAGEVIQESPISRQIKQKTIRLN